MADHREIKDYLLGLIGDEERLAVIEEKIFSDDDFHQQIEFAEHELIEDYIDGNLSNDESDAFARHFLINDGRKKELTLVRGLRKYARENPPPAAPHPAANGWRRWFAMPALRFAAALLVVATVGLGVWRFAFYRSDLDLGLAQLELAYRERRPVEARVSGLSYAPWDNTRGGGRKKEPARDRAELLLTKAAADRENAATLSALGRFYLADRDFEKADDAFKRAAAFGADDAGLQSDWGAALLEMGKAARSDGQRGKSLEQLDQSLGHLDAAIKLAPSMPEPRYNRALCLQALNLTEQAKIAWREYLGIDASSQWADEARRNLQALDSAAAVNIKPDEVQSKYLDDVAADDRDAAWQTLSNNRELITRKYIPIRMTMAAAASSGTERARYINALEYAGRLESERTGDKFVADLAGYYAKLGSANLSRHDAAQVAVRNGYALALDAQYGPALDEFLKAQKTFNDVGDIWEAKLSEYYAGYCQVNLGRPDESIRTIGSVVEFARSRNYKWLEATSLNWFAGSQRVLRQHSLSKFSYSRALSLAESVGDRYAIQRNLLELSSDSSFVGQRDTALEYLQRAIEVSRAENTSVRQRYRNYSDGSQTLLSAGLKSLGKAAVTEAIILADITEDRMFKTISRIYAANAFMQNGDMLEARLAVEDSLKLAESFDDPDTRRKMTARSYLQSAVLAEHDRDLRRATEMYGAASAIYATLPMPFNQYVALKGDLNSLNALGEYDEVDRRLPEALKIIEDYRENLTEEKERTSFFDNGVSVYDIAVERAFDKGDLDAAFNYSELSSSRSLIDRLSSRLGNPGAGPLDTAAVRKRMPVNAQLLKFTILDKRLLIWVISGDSVTAVPVTADAASLRDKVGTFVRLLRSGRGADPAQVNIAGRELFEILIAPVIDRLSPDRDLCIVPSGFLYYLPFAALLEPDGRPLIARHNLLYSPSASVFILCSENAASKSTAGESLLAVGNPSFSRADFRELNDLPSADAETELIGSLYGKSTVLSGNHATKSAFVENAGSADVIHFAGHYVAAEREPSSSYLLFAGVDGRPGDSMLTNAELDKLDLPRAALVVLSACQTGIEDHFQGEGMIGLTRTFVAAGAPVVVASQWKVDTAAAADLMARFHTYRRRGGKNSSQALRAAQLDMADEPGGRFVSPYFWAAFAVYGGFSSF